jgi:ligand-binding sensor domain-containing protein
VTSGITRYVEESAGITAYRQVEWVVPEPVHSDWVTLASQASIQALAVSRHDRRVWLATWGGVLSWDPARFRCHRYGSEHGLAGNAAGCICLDTEERPWVGHVEGGLSHFNGEQWQPYGWLQDQQIRTVATADAGTGLWAATMNAVYRVNGADAPPDLVASGHTGATDPMALLADSGRLLLGNLSGLFRLEPGHDPVTVAAEAISTCVALARGAGGATWVATIDAVYRLEEESVRDGPYGPAPGEPLQQMLAISPAPGGAWVLTTAGLAWIGREGWVSLAWPDSAAEPPAIRAIAADPGEDYLWLGTDRLLAGVRSSARAQARWDIGILPCEGQDELANLSRCIAAPTGDRIVIGTVGGLLTWGPDEHWRHDPTAGDVRALAGGGAEPQKAWLLSWPHGVGRLGQSAAPDYRLPQPPGLPVALAAADREPYVLTGRGLYRIRGNRVEEVAGPPPVTVRCLVPTQDGTWWAGTVRGVYRLDGRRWKLAGERPGPLDAEVFALGFHDGSLWAATAVGLWARQEQQWVGHLQGPAGDPWPIRALGVEESSGALWLADDNGVFRYDPATRISGPAFTPLNSGLPSRRVAALAADAHVLWIVTDTGSSRCTLD